MTEANSMQTRDPAKSFGPAPPPAERDALRGEDPIQSARMHEAAYQQLYAYVQDLHRVIAERNRALDAARAAEAAKRNFLANMSHEFRTPLTAILGFAEFLRTKQSDAKDGELLARIVLAARSIDGLVDNLLTMARLDAGTLPLEPKLCDVAALVVEESAQFEARANAKGLQYELRLPPQPAMHIVTDGTRLAQALGVLLDNAIKYTSEGKVCVELVADTASSLPLRIEVRDTGCGIGAAFRDRLFELFEQEDSSSTRRFDGAGLGLAMARALLGLVGCRLALSDGSSPGSTFIISFPHAST
jgi:signal transduction histidine kinase